LLQYRLAGQRQTGLIWNPPDEPQTLIRFQGLFSSEDSTSV
jgi:hypothetical protein